MLAACDALAPKGVAHVVEAVVVLLALLEPVDDLDELRLHRQRLGLLGVALRVEVRLHLARFAAQQTRMKG